MLFYNVYSQTELHSLYKRKEIEMVDKYLTPTEAADRLGISRCTISQWVRKGLIKVEYYPSGRYMILESEIAKYPNLSKGGQNAS